MPQIIKKVLGAMFDVRPVDKFGRVDVARIKSLSTKVNLGRFDYSAGILSRG